MDRSAVVFTLFVLVILLGGWTLVLHREVTHLSSGARSQENEGWQCTTLACAKNIDLGTWQKDNCYYDQNQNLTVCKLVLNGESQVIPISQLNLSYLSAQCSSYICTQEVKVRVTNYTVDLNTSQIKIR